MIVIVLGSEGFIGSHLCRHFNELAYEVYGVDILETPANIKYHYTKVSRLSSHWEELLKTVNADICINASGSGNVSYSVVHPVIDFEANTLDVLIFLDALRKYRPACKYLHISSAAVYGNPQTLPIKENDVLQPISPYGFHKKMSEILCKEYHQLFGISLAIVRPFSIFGNGLRKQLIWEICNNLQKVDHISLFGTGTETRDFIHVSDFVLLVQIIIEKASFTGEVYNAGGGHQIQIKQIASIFEEYYQNNKTISFNGNSRKGDPINWEADITIAKTMGFSPTVNIRTAVLDYINWFNSLDK